MARPSEQGVIYALYSCLLSLFLPLVFLRLWYKGRKNAAYRAHWSERLGNLPFRTDSSIWLHAVSLGEMVAAAPLIQALIERVPDQKLVLTCMTPTGRTEAAKWAIKFPKQIFVSYLPYDTAPCIKKALRHIHPKLLIVMETELWPNLFRWVKVPIFVINARISDRALPSYQKIKCLMRFIFRHVSEVLAQSEIDKNRFVALGAKQVSVMGNIKYDLPDPSAIFTKATLLKSTWPARLILAAGSTHEGEEQALLSAYQSLKPVHPSLLLILIPRRPERFASVANLCQEMHLSCLKFSENKALTNEDIFLVDAMGEAKTFYALADVVFIGGSLVPVGGHNILEAAIFAKPIIVGPNMQNARAIVRDFLSHHALIQTPDSVQLTPDLQRLFADNTLRQNLGQNAQLLMTENRGALSKVLQRIAPYLE